MKKRVLSLLLCLCMALSLLPAAASAATAVTKITLTMTEPAAGKAPAKTATVPSTASTAVKSVKWYGEFDSKGNFKPGMKYTVDFVIAVKDGQDKVISLTSKSDITVNGHKITHGSVDDTGRQATLQYTYAIPAGAADAAVPGELGYLSGGTGKIQNVSDGKVLNVYDSPDSTVRTKLGSVKNGDTVEVLAAYVGGRGQSGSQHAIKWDGGVAYIPAYKNTDLVTWNYVAMTRDDGPTAPSGAAFTKGDFGFATLDSLIGADVYLRAASPSEDGQTYVGKILNGDQVYVLNVGVLGENGLTTYDRVLWKGQIGFMLCRQPELTWKDAVVLGKSDYKLPVELKEAGIPMFSLNPKLGAKGPTPGVEARLMWADTPVTVGMTAGSATVESIKYGQSGPAAPHSLVSATVTFKAKEGCAFPDDLPVNPAIYTGVVYNEKSKDTVVATFYGVTTGEGYDKAPTEEMKTAHQRNMEIRTAGYATVATGVRNSAFSNLKVYSYPTTAKGDGLVSLTMGDLPSSVTILDLHAERKFAGVAGQWYMVNCAGDPGYVPAAYVKNVKESGFWDGAPAVQRDGVPAFAGGTGTKEDPYLVATAEQLNAIRFGLDRHYKLIADIDLSNWGNWQPIGGTPAYGGWSNATNQKADKGQAPFTGTLNGNHHVISGMTIIDHREAPWTLENYSDRSYGLFCKVYGDNMGGVASKYDNDAARTIWDLGMVNYTIDLSYTNVTKNLSLYVAPFFGRGSNMCMDNCYAAGGTIKVNYGGTEPPNIMIGGLVGNIAIATIRNCYNASDITITTAPGYKATDKDYNQASGIAAGITSTWVHDCFNTGDITVPFAEWWRASSASGLVGDTYPPEFPVLYYYPETGLASVVKDCYNTGTITANAANGILDGGSTDVYVYRSYNVGKLVTGGTDPIPGDIIAPYSLVITEGHGFVHDNGQASCSTASWQTSSKLGRKVLKSNPEDSLKIPEVKPAGPSIPATGTSYAMKQTAMLDGREIAFDTYALKDAAGNGTNYMKIRDLAYVLNGTAVQFALGYDAGTISFKSKTPYAPNGTEMTVPFTGDQPYSVTPGTFLVDGVKKELTTISILDTAGNGYTYIKVRDLAETLNFYVGWDGKIVIDTNKSYAG